MKGKIPHIVVSLWGIPRRVLRALMIHRGSSGDEEFKVQEMWMRMRTRMRDDDGGQQEEEKMGLVMW